MREAGREEGLACGREELLKALLDLYQDGTITLDIIKAKTGKSDEEIEEALNGHKI